MSAAVSGSPSSSCSNPFRPPRNICNDSSPHHPLRTWRPQGRKPGSCGCSFEIQRTSRPNRQFSAIFLPLRHKRHQERRRREIRMPGPGFSSMLRIQGRRHVQNGIRGDQPSGRLAIFTSVHGSGRSVPAGTIQASTLCPQVRTVPVLYVFALWLTTASAQSARASLLGPLGGG